jgi:hypothetical protein
VALRAIPGIAPEFCPRDVTEAGDVLAGQLQHTADTCLPAPTGHAGDVSEIPRIGLIRGWRLILSKSVRITWKLEPSYSLAQKCRPGRKRPLPTGVAQKRFVDSAGLVTEPRPKGAVRLAGSRILRRRAVC